MLLVFFWQVNPDYENVFIFPNGFPALLKEGPSPGKAYLLATSFRYPLLRDYLQEILPTCICTAENSDDPLFKSEAAYGNCQVMCFHPWSDITLPLMQLSEIRCVIDKWSEIAKEEGKQYSWVQVCILSNSLLLFAEISSF